MGEKQKEKGKVLAGAEKKYSTLSHSLYTLKQTQELIESSIDRSEGETTAKVKRRQKTWRIPPPTIILNRRATEGLLPFWYSRGQLNNLAAAPKVLNVSI